MTCLADMRCRKSIFFLLLVSVLSESGFETFAKAPCFGNSKRYVVSQKTDLKGKEIHLSGKTTLVFEGNGSFSNGTILGNDIRIVASEKPVFSSSVMTRFENTKLKSSWYEDLLTCITANNKCAIDIVAGEYSINNPIYVKITNSLKGMGTVTIKHTNSFTIGDNVTIEDISWDGQDKAEYWMYCQPNNLTLRSCTFQNYYGKSAGIVYWSHSERDTENLLIENCTFGRLGAKENGMIGDNDGSSFAVYTYRCRNLIIRKCKFENQYGIEDSDAIKLEGGRINVEGNFPLPSGDSFKYTDIKAAIEGNEFVNVPKSPVKVFASGVTVRNNKMSYRGEVKTAIARMFRGEDLLIEGNVAECEDAVSNAIEVYGCQNVRLNNNTVSSTCVDGKSFGELLRIEKSNNVDVTGMGIMMASSSKANINQALVRLSGKDITIKNCHFRAPYSYYGIYAPLGIEGLKVERTTFEVIQGIQYAFLVNNAVKEPQGTCTFNKCTFRLADYKIDDATSYGAVFAHDIIVKDCEFDYAKGITLNAEKVDVRRSKARKFNIQEQKTEVGKR